MSKHLWTKTASVRLVCACVSWLLEYMTDSQYMIVVDFSDSYTRELLVLLMSQLCCFCRGTDDTGYTCLMRRGNNYSCLSV